MFIPSVTRGDSANKGSLTETEACRVSAILLERIEQIFMLPKYNKDLIRFAKALRKDMTKEERHLWYDFLRDYPIKFYRQKVLGKYIADFYCAKAKLVIELDGSQHYDPENMANDLTRTKYLNELGLSVVRITNKDINDNFYGVCEYIDKIVKTQYNV